MSIEASLHCEPHPSTSNWHSSDDIISSDNSVDKNQNENFVVQHTEEVLELEEIETHSSETGSNSTELQIPPPPALIARPGECQLKRKRPSNERESGVCPEKKKRDLEVRKDLIMPTAPTAGVDNVFQVFSITVHFWGQERGLLAGLKERVWERGKEASALG